MKISEILLNFLNKSLLIRVTRMVEVVNYEQIFNMIFYRKLNFNVCITLCINRNAL